MVAGREYIIAPLTSIVPGVLSGSKGRLMYPESEIRNSVKAWDDMPICIGHPYDPMTNAHLSAENDGVLERQGVGVLRNSEWNGKLQHEAWFDSAKLRKVDPDVYNLLVSGKRVEVSTGLYTNNVPAPQGSSFKGKPYDFIAKDYKPDHMAVLPQGQVGACSLDDGCGLMVNAESKPSNCTCQYPKIKLRNGSGHSPDCPCHKEWLAKGGFKPKTVNNLISEQEVRQHAFQKAGEYLRKNGLSDGGYGQVWWNEGTGEAWYVGADGDERDFFKAVQAKLKSVPGVESVRHEAESSPKGPGWVKVFPQETTGNANLTINTWSDEARAASIIARRHAAGAYSGVDRLANTVEGRSAVAASRTARDYSVIAAKTNTVQAHKDAAEANYNAADEVRTRVRNGQTTEERRVAQVIADRHEEAGAEHDHAVNILESGKLSGEAAKAAAVSLESVKATRAIGNDPESLGDRNNSRQAFALASKGSSKQAIKAHEETASRLRSEGHSDAADAHAIAADFHKQLTANAKEPTSKTGHLDAVRKSASSARRTGSKEFKPPKGADPYDAKRAAKLSRTADYHSESALYASERVNELKTAKGTSASGPRRAAAKLHDDAAAAHELAAKAHHKAGNDAAAEKHRMAATEHTFASHHEEGQAGKADHEEQQAQWQALNPQQVGVPQQATTVAPSVVGNAWSDEARAAALEARRASVEAHKTTDSLSKWHSGGEARDILGASKRALKDSAVAVRTGRETDDKPLAKEYHRQAEMDHEDAAEILRLSGNDIRHEEAAVLHDRAAKLHGRASKLVTNAWTELPAENCGGEGGKPGPCPTGQAASPPAGTVPTAGATPEAKPATATSVGKQLGDEVSPEMAKSPALQGLFSKVLKTVTGAIKYLHANELPAWAIEHADVWMRDEMISSQRGSALAVKVAAFAVSKAIQGTKALVGKLRGATANAESDLAAVTLKLHDAMTRISEVTGFKVPSSAALAKLLKARKDAGDTQNANPEGHNQYSSTGSSDLRSHVKALYAKLYMSPGLKMKERERAALTKEYQAGAKELASQPAAALGAKPELSKVTDGDVASLAKHIGLIDQEKQRYGLVHLGDLREAHPQWDKPKFDAVLAEARKRGKVSLSAEEGRHGSTQRDKDSGVQEDGRNLLFASVRNSRNVTGNRWVTLGDESNNPGQHAWVGEGGEFSPFGPGEKAAAVAEKPAKMKPPALTKAKEQENKPAAKEPELARASPVSRGLSGKESLRTAAVVDSKPLGGGVNKTDIITLADGSKAIFKTASGEDTEHRPSNVKGGYHVREAAASDVADLLGMHDMVPPTVVRTVNGEKGSAQAFVSGAKVASEVPFEKMFNGSKDLARAAAFDYLIGSQDRHSGNWLIDGKGKMTLIDNGLAFPSKLQDEWTMMSRRLADKAGDRKLPVPEEFKKLDPAKLESLLKGHGLSEREVRLTGWRLKNLQRSDDMNRVRSRHRKKLED